MGLFLCLGIQAKVLPDVKVENIKGEQVGIRSLVNGRPVIISFWGVTCKPCIQELNTLNENLSDWKKEADFNIIAVSIDDSRFTARARSMVKGFNWQFQSVFDKNQDLKRAMNVTLTPQVFIVDAKGNIIYSHTGYTPGSELELLAKIKTLQVQ